MLTRDKLSTHGWWRRYPFATHRISAQSNTLAPSLTWPLQCLGAAKPLGLGLKRLCYPHENLALPCLRLHQLLLPSINNTRRKLCNSHNQPLSFSNVILRALSIGNRILQLLKRPHKQATLVSLFAFPFAHSMAAVPWDFLSNLPSLCRGKVEPYC